MSGTDPSALADWHRIRRFAVPDWMIAECTAARERGDWRAACAVARIDVGDIPPDLAHTLAGFAPDLVRWHLPRVLGGHTTLATDLLIVLNQSDPTLVLRMPRSVIGSQRLTLDVVPRASVAARRYVRMDHCYWDAREAHDLRTVVDGTPFFDSGGYPLPSPALDAGAERAPVDRGWSGYWKPVLTPQVDLDLVRFGLLTPGDLHPLVRAALFPARMTSAPTPPAAAEPVRVRCGGEWHQVLHRAGQLALLSHSTSERRRERALRAFGGPVTGCFAVEQSWTSPSGWLPRRLRVARDEVWLRIQHGGSRVVRELLAEGMDPDIRDSRGRNLVHAIGWFADEGLLPLLLSSGAEVDARDREGYTALARAVSYPWPLKVIKALVEAGADPGGQSVDDLPGVPISRCRHIRQRIARKGADPESMAVIKYFEQLT